MTRNTRKCVENLCEATDDPGLAAMCERALENDASLWDMATSKPVEPEEFQGGVAVYIKAVCRSLDQEKRSTVTVEGRRVYAA